VKVGFPYWTLLRAYTIDNMTDTTVVVAARRERKFFTSSKGTLTECHFKFSKIGLKKVVLDRVGIIQLINVPVNVS